MRFDSLTREEIRVLAPDGVAVVPCGAIEQHGPHVAVGADTIFVTNVCNMASEKVEGRATVLVAPAITYGISDHHKPHPGVLSLRPETFIALLRDLGVCLSESGFRRIVFINGHNGNEDAIKIVARDLNNFRDGAFAATSYWTAAWKQLEAAEIVDGVARIPGHAGKFETAMMLAIDRGLVREKQIPPVLPAPQNARQSIKPAVFPRQGNHGHGPGYSDAPSEASAEFGQKILAACVDGLAEFLIEFSKQK